MSLPSRKAAFLRQLIAQCPAFPLFHPILTTLEPIEVLADKFAVVLETASLNEADLAEYCRKKGLYAEQISTAEVA